MNEIASFPGSPKSACIRPLTVQESILVRSKGHMHAQGKAYEQDITCSNTHIRVHCISCMYMYIYISVHEIQVHVYIHVCTSTVYVQVHVFLLM